MTIGRCKHGKFDRKDLGRVLDLRTRMLLNEVLRAPRGRSIEAYIKAFRSADIGPRTGRSG
ncbi:MAG: hypothetical protein H6595_10875 [Flavobacteriales bacterium]|nr:hypothetical protein [Flavobacteriales bacterium]MCB9167965.1 hypothetical protein [Flavobacteriales bacterium]